MQINAKFASKCPTCTKPIVVGEKVDWAPGKSAVHSACAPKPTCDGENHKRVVCEGCHIWVLPNRAYRARWSNGTVRVRCENYFPRGTRIFDVWFCGTCKVTDDKREAERAVRWNAMQKAKSAAVQA